jgi:hypothetical protein
MSGAHGCTGRTPRGVILRRLHRAERELDQFNLLYLGRLVRWDSATWRYRPLDPDDPLSRLAADVGDQIQREIILLDTLARQCTGEGGLEEADGR